MDFKTLPIAALALLAAVPAASAASRASVTADLNMRAGPSTSYPVITTVPNGRGVTVYGCVKNFNWCDASYSGVRGWVYSAYLNYRYQGRRQPLSRVGPSIGLPIISFSFGDYSNRHYRGHRYDNVRNWWDRRHGGGNRHEGRRGDRDHRGDRFEGRRDRGDWDRGDRRGRGGDFAGRDRRGDDGRRFGERNGRDNFRDMMRACRTNPVIDCPRPRGSN